MSISTVARVNVLWATVRRVTDLAAETVGTVGLVVSTQLQLVNLMNAFNAAYPAMPVNQTRFFAYLQDTGQTQQNLVDGDITEDELVTWWKDNPNWL